MSEPQKATQILIETCPHDGTAKLSLMDETGGVFAVAYFAAAPVAELLRQFLPERAPSEAMH